MDQVSSTDQINFIRECLQNSNHDYVKINVESLQIIYDLFKNDKILEDNIITTFQDSNIFLYYSVYHKMKLNFEKSKHYLMIAIEKNNAIAMTNLGIYYSDIILMEGYEVNYKEAMKWFLKASELGNADAMYNAGCLYDCGCGVKQNNVKAFAWYKKASELGCRESMLQVGYCYYHNYGVEQNFGEAVKWYQKASDMGFDDATTELARCVYHGRGIEKNCARAINLLTKLVSNEGAKKLLKYIVKKNYESIAKSILDFSMKNLELENINNHLNLYPGCDYNSAMQDYNLNL